MKRRTSHVKGRRAKRRHGIAMLLVLISLMTVTVITAAYLASRDNSGAIGENVANAAAARWAAASGLDLAIAMLETEGTWRTGHSNGVVISNYGFADTTLSLTISDIETAAPPTAVSTYLEAFAIATAGNLQHEATAMMIAPVPHVVNVDLSEFALYAANGIQLTNQSRLDRWPEAPLSKLKLPVSVGTHSIGIGSVSVANTAFAQDAMVWCAPGSTTLTVSNASLFDVNMIVMEDLIPFPSAPTPQISGGSTSSGSLLGMLVSAVNDILSLANLELVDMVVEGVMHLLFNDGNAVIVDTDMVISENASLQVSGNAVIVVHGDMQVLGSGAIELVGNGSLMIFVAGDVDIRGYIGEAGGRNGGPNSDGMGHADVSRIHLFSMDTGEQRNWRVRQSALVKANIYAPDAILQLMGTSRLCGRAAAGRIEMSNQAAVYYDHGLDRRTGYTNPASPIYDPDGRIKPEFVDLESLDDSDLDALAASTNTKLYAAKREYGSAPLTDANLVAGESTPRPVPVAISRIKLNTSVEDWER